MPKQNRQSPKTVLGKVRAVLDTFSAEQSTQSLTDIVQRSGLPKPTVFRLLQELTELGFLSHDGKFYQLGIVAYRIGMIAKQQLDLEVIFDDLLAPLAEATGETVITAMIDRAQILYLHVIESRSPLRFVAGAGARRDIPFGATGMCLLSQLPLEERKGLLTPPFKHFTAKTITTQAAYLERLERAAADQLVIETGEYYDGIMAIAIPVPSQTPLTFTVVGPEERVRPNQDLIISQLKEAAGAFATLGIRL